MDKFEEYKFFAESTQYLSERRQAATQTYLTVNTAIFGIFAFLVNNIDSIGWTLAAMSLPLILVGLFACFTWLRIIQQYKDLIAWRYDQLMEIEKAMKDCHQMYLKEWDNFFKPKRKKKGFGFSRLESALPRLFMTLYIVYCMGLLSYIIFSTTWSD